MWPAETSNYDEVNLALSDTGKLSDNRDKGKRR